MDHAGGDQADVVVLDIPVLEDGERDVEEEAVLKKRERCHIAQVSLICICATLRSWGHLSFNYYLVKTDPMLHIFGSKIISLTFIDILNANLSEIETL